MPFAALSQAQSTLLITGAAIGVIGSALLFIPNRNERVRTRILAMKPVTAPAPGAPAFDAINFGGLGKWLGGLMGPKEQEKLANALHGAGIAGKDALAIYIAIKASLAVALLLFAYVFEISTELLSDLMFPRMAFYLGAVLGGWRLPDFYINRKAAGRKGKIKEGVADVLDLLVICTEAGLGLEQSLDRISRDIKIANPVIAAELTITVAEMRVLPQMRDALDNFAKRSGVPIVKSVVTTLVQSIQYGTPLGQSLRVLAAEMRQHRILELEAKAARLPVFLTIPLILFILPCLFLIVAGPAGMQLVRTLK